MNQHRDSEVIVLLCSHFHKCVQENVCNSTKNPNCWFFAEPTNNLPPKLIGERTAWKIAAHSLGSDIAVMCPVVGFPFPVFK